MVGSGFFWFASVLQDAHSGWPFTVGYALQVVYLAGFVYLILAFPSGRLRGTFDRAFVVAAFGLVTIAQLAFMLVADSPTVLCARCPANLVEVARNDTLAHDLMQFQRVAGLAVIGITRTAGVVTSAALVMVGVCSIFGTLSQLDVKQAGVGLAAAVLIDATIVRGVLLPASMKLLGDWNWYLPRWLDRRLPLANPETSESKAIGVPAPAATHD
jgi:uncharacterized membrane protein YdfJ with MMPL/SSD domain